jgi:hypothetical protein
MINKWKHTDKCTPTECYCADSDFPDPVCECGCPGWACVSSNSSLPSNQAISSQIEIESDEMCEENEMGL